MARAVGEVGSDAWVLAQSRRGLGGDPARRAALQCADGEREQRGRQGKEKMDCFAISEISRDLNVKQG